MITGIKVLPYGLDPAWYEKVYSDEPRAMRFLVRRLNFLTAEYQADSRYTGPKMAWKTFERTVRWMLLRISRFLRWSGYQTAAADTNAARLVLTSIFLLAFVVGFVAHTLFGLVTR